MMNTPLLLTFCSVASIAVQASQAATIASFANGIDTDNNALINKALTDTAYTVTNLTRIGFEGAPLITRNEFGATPTTPAGPTAGSNSGSEWFFARASFMTYNDSTTVDDYFGFTVTANGSNTLNLESLKYDLVSVANSGFTDSFTAKAEAFISVDGGSFSAIDAITATSLGSAEGFGIVNSANFDLSAYTGAASIEIRIALSDDITNAGLNQAGAASFLQGIQLNGTAIPEPSTYALFTGLSIMCLASARRKFHR